MEVTNVLTVIKSLNNNIVLATTEKGEELVAFGTGIGFKKKKGETVPYSDATKIFKTSQTAQANELLEEVPLDVLTVTEKIVAYGEQTLGKKLNSSILFSLADHLRFAVERTEQEIVMEMPFQWEIPHLYFEEYEVGKEALVLIQEAVGVSLPMTEASFIALHFVNAQMDNQTMGDTIQMTQVTKGIVKIIQSLFDVTLDKTTMTYSRFITHLRYFIARQKAGNNKMVEMDSELRDIIRERYVKSYACGLMIKEKLEKDYGWQVTEDELIYLVIHIERIIKENTI